MPNKDLHDLHGQLIKQENENFTDVLGFLEKKYFHNGGDPDAEVIVSWNKREVKEDGLISFYATNSLVASAIKRCRKGIRAIRFTSSGAELFFDSKFVRPLHTVLKIKKQRSEKIFFTNHRQDRHKHLIYQLAAILQYQEHRQVFYQQAPSPSMLLTFQNFL